MESMCVRQTLIPGTSKLLADYLYHFDKVSAFYSWPIGDLDSFRKAAEQIRFPEERRAAIVSALREQNGDSPALSRLAKSGTLAVVTGQQVGLFSGPAYTIFKALTAVKLAQDLTSSGLPAVPVFWLATEDHDLAEVDHAWMFNHLGLPQRVLLEDTPGTGGPVGSVGLGGVRLQKLRQALGDLPYAEGVFTLVQQAYRPEATLGSAFSALVRQILKDFDLLYLDPLAPSIRTISAPFLSQAVDRLPELTARLRERDSELRAAGYHSQVHIEADTSLLFLLRDGKRVPLRWKEGRFVAGKDSSFSSEELHAAAEHLSPNALLRPVMQDYLLPTVSYVGGPAEIAYMAQAQVLYQDLLGRMPVILPRNGFTLLDGRSSKVMERYGMRLPDLLGHAQDVRQCIASKLVPASLLTELDEVRNSIQSSVHKLQDELSRFDSTLEESAQKGAAKISYQIAKLSRKTAREALRRNKRAEAEASSLMNLVYPHEHLQERFYSILPFLAKHGLDLPKRLMNEVQLACPDHMVRVM